MHRLALSPEDPVSKERAATETRLRAAFDAHDYGVAATLGLEAYGPSILGLLAALHRDDRAAEEAFAMFAEDLWRGLPRFAWSSSFRTWAYTLARNASLRHAKSARRSGRREVPLSLAPNVSALVARLRTETLPHLRTQSKSRLAEIRDQLDEDDRLLLILRVDRELEWEEVARVTLGDAAGTAASDDLDREVVRLRKHFQRVKARLVELGRQHGLLPRRDDDTR